jgi:hypothetical protein
MNEEHKHQKRQIKTRVPEIRKLHNTLVPTAMTDQKFWLLYFILTVDYAGGFEDFDKVDDDFP